jgi:DNA-binding SARP family transcriptional activator
VLDPARAHDADAFVAADRENVWLDLAAAELDVARFLDAARRALSASPPSVDDLTAAEARYSGEFLDDDPYVDWAVGTREEARAVYLRVAQRLAEQLDAAGELDRAGHLYLRLLQRDPYDEAAHLALVRVLDRAGHRGEARRAYRSYSARMAELDVEPAAYPATNPAAGPA